MKELLESGGATIFNDVQEYTTLNVGEAWRVIWIGLYRKLRS